MTRDRVIDAIKSRHPSMGWEETTVSERSFWRHESRGVKLIADLERYRNLRTSLADKQTREALDQLVRETEERLRQVDTPEQC
jgi:hypothetical protein